MGYLPLLAFWICLPSASPASPPQGSTLGSTANLSSGSPVWSTVTSAGTLCDKAGPYALCGYISQAAMPIRGFVGAGPYYVIGGFWSSEFNGRLGQNRDEVVVSSFKPGTFRLFRNYPNPFRLRTRIAYDLPARCRVHLDIYDLGGRQVRRLAAGWQVPGRYSVNWDGRDTRGGACPPGVYFCSLRTEDSAAVEKILIAE